MKSFFPILLLTLCPVVMARSLTPFGDGLSYAPKPVKAVAVAKAEPHFLGAELAPLWSLENPRPGTEGKVFSFERSGDQDVLRINAEFLEPGKTTLRLPLPGDGPANGTLWARNKASLVTFLCQSDKPAQMSFHLLQRGKSAGSFSARFRVKPETWEQVVLPITDFNLKSFDKVSGLGFRVVSAEKGTEVRIKDIRITSAPFSDAAWASHLLKIKIDGDWKFAADPGEKGLQEKWFDFSFDDSGWKVLQAGLDWQAQGVEHHGYGWYRQQIFVPKEFQGVPLKVTLCEIKSDDDIWFNGERIGGFSGEYKYNNWNTRTYLVPPKLIRYGENNSIALRIWGGNITFIGNKSGLVKGPLVAELDPYLVKLREPGGEAVAADLFDFSDMQQGRGFEILIPFPVELAQGEGLRMNYRLVDSTGAEITSGAVPLAPATEGPAQAVVPVDAETSRTVYLRGRFWAQVVLQDAAGTLLYAGTRAFDRPSFAKRDALTLPPLEEKFEETPYGKLKLIDEIDLATPVFEDPHPYMQSGYEKAQERMPPGSEVDVKVSDILGRNAKESAYGWFAYRIGRGKLNPRSTYLLRMEYPEDKPRFAPIEIQVGQNFMDVGWKSGVAPDDVYENWPITKKWSSYDVVVPLDDETVGTGGTGTASAEHGFWVYFMNKRADGGFYTMWDAGPAVGKMKLYEIDPAKDAPVIQRPEGLPNRVLALDWERQPDGNPEDIVKYAKLMGYTAVSPIIIKWHFMNYSDPLNGYTSILIDDQNYWANKPYDPAKGEPAASPLPGKKTQHQLFLEATKRWGLDYIPRFEWGGSQDLPEEAKAIGTDGKLAKPNRFAQWSGNLLHPATWEDLKTLMDHFIKPYVKDNPQLTGVLWRIRCDRMPISYGEADLELFSKETNTPLPAGGLAQKVAWATGEGRAKYDDWWHKKRADFHKRLAALLQSYRPGMELYYYNWDGDKFGLILPDTTAWAFKAAVMKPAPEGGRAAYEAERAERKKLTAADYIETVRTGNFGEASKGINRADYGLRPELYRDTEGIQLFAPANYLCYADKPEYLNYFRTKDGLAVCNVVSYDEVNARTINPKYEGNMITPGGPAFSMALELLAYFHGDARTLNYTVYTFGRGYADAHRRFAQAFLALPAIAGTVLDQADPDVKVRLYPSEKGTYLGVAFKGYEGKALTITIPGKAGGKLKNLVTNEFVKTTDSGGGLQFVIESGPMELHAFRLE